jgi:hypothetical protein
VTTNPSNLADASAAVEIERQLIRLLCSRDVRPAELRRLAAEFSSRSWRDAEHEMIFRAICDLAGRDHQSLRSELPAQATRMGFPDVEWSIYLDASARPESSLEEIIGELKRLDAAQP